MGYRSNVTCVITFANEDHKAACLMAWRMQHGPCPFDEGQDMADEVTHRMSQGHPAIVMQAEDTKWYEAYDSVARWNRFMENMQERQASTSYIRIGEEDEDTEIECCGSEHPDLADYDHWEPVRLCRSIELNLDEEKEDE